VKLRLTEYADGDIAEALSNSYVMFGERQAARYSETIKAGLAMISAEPLRPASKLRHELGYGVRSFHLQFAAGRHGGASHVLYYRIDAQRAANSVVVLRLLGDRMEPDPHVAAALSADSE